MSFNKGRISINFHNLNMTPQLTYGYDTQNLLCPFKILIIPNPQIPNFSALTHFTRRNKYEEEWKNKTGLEDL